MLAKISKCLCWNLFIGATTQIRAVHKDPRILITFKKCITLSFQFLDLQHKISIVLWLGTFKNISHLFGNTGNKTKAFNLKVNCKELRLIFVHHVHTVHIPKHLRLFEQVDTLYFYVIFISIIILLSLWGNSHEITAFKSCL